VALFPPFLIFLPIQGKRTSYVFLKDVGAEIQGVRASPEAWGVPRVLCVPSGDTGDIFVGVRRDHAPTLQEKGDRARGSEPVCSWLAVWVQGC
jgi:hypothetical protein